MTTKKQLREKLRDFLIDLALDGKDYYEYNDGGVWATDKAVDQLLLLLDQYADEARIDELERLDRTPHGSAFVYGYVPGRLESLKKEKL